MSFKVSIMSLGVQHPLWHLQFVPREALGNLAPMVDQMLDIPIVYRPDKRIKDMTPEEKSTWKKNNRHAWETMDPGVKDQIKQAEREKRKERRARKKAEKAEQPKQPKQSKQSKQPKQPKQPKQQ